MSELTYEDMRIKVRDFCLSVSRFGVCVEDDLRRKEWRKKCREEHLSVPYAEYCVWELYDILFNGKGGQ